METDSGVAKIAKLNDEFRRSGNGIVITPGIEAFGLVSMSRLIDEIRRFNEFTEDNDPYREHDFGSLEWCGQKVFWKVDYYDQALKYGRHPIDLDCRRVMTVMLASEY